MSQHNKRAKFCVIGPSKRFFSGLTVYTICLANALTEGNDVSVVLLRELMPQFLYPGKEHVGREDYLVGFLPGLHVYDGVDWNSPLSWVRAYRFLKQQKPDVIIMQWWTSVVAHMQLFLVLANKLKIKANLIIEMHEIVDPLEEDILPVRLYSRMMGKLLMMIADAFVVHSDSVRERAIQTYHLRDDRVFVIPHGLYDIYYQDCDKHESKAKLGIEEKFVILYFGLIRRYKGVPHLVEAFNRLPQHIAQHSRLVIAGEDWGDVTSLVDSINPSRYRDQITLQPRFIPDDMIPQYFSAADVVVLPYLRTSGSGVASIAMAYGKPIITSALETMREWLMDYEGAMFVPRGDFAAIADKLTEIYRRCASGSDVVYNPPGNTWDKIAKRYEQTMKQLASHKGQE